MKTCSICNTQYDRGGGPGPKDEPLCPAHYTRFLRGSATWKDPMLRGSADLARIRVTAETKARLERSYAKALKTRPALPMYTFLDEVIEAGLARKP
jgi:hypothetical protein